jgi:two-component system, OmpR family, sensor kinase
MTDDGENESKVDVLAAAASLNATARSPETDGAVPMFLNAESLAAEVVTFSKPASRVPSDADQIKAYQHVLAEADRRYEALKNALAARDQFISVISHELRNAVAPVFLLAEVFKDLATETPDARLPARVEKLTKQLHRFATTIDRVTEVAQLRDRRLQLRITDVDMSAEVMHVASSRSAQALAGSVKFAIDAPASVTGRWDRSRLRQIVGNLLSNAIRYGGGGIVELTARSYGREAQLEVRDHGPGVPVDELPTIFDRLDMPLRRRTGGFGVGLFVVKALCLAMNGNVKVENAHDGGARFSVVLPRG